MWCSLRTSRIVPLLLLMTIECVTRVQRPAPLIVVAGPQPGGRHRGGLGHAHQFEGQIAVWNFGREVVGGHAAAGVLAGNLLLAATYIRLRFAVTQFLDTRVNGLVAQRLPAFCLTVPDIDAPAYTGRMAVSMA